MIHSRKLAQLARKLQHRMAAAGTTDGCSSSSSMASSTSCLAGRGHCAVYTADGARSEVPMPYLGAAVLGELLTMSREEFGFAGGDDGRITLPCDASVMEYAMCLLRRDASEDVERAFLSSIARPSCYNAGSQQSLAVCM
uniref:Auxin-responsive protein n=1 Tax=Oryza brachyantha TaxID=4533 RepID=J3MZR8_ORYBR